MCGIGGWFCQGEARPSPDVLKGLLLANMERGTSASGFAYQEGADIRIIKAKGPASLLIESTDAIIQKAAASPRGLLHARATTKGSEEQNENNHPVAGFEWAVVHNGTIMNDDDVWSFYSKRDNVQRFAAVDTSAIPLVLSRGKSVEEAINLLSILGGSLTLAAWSSSDIERMVLARFGYNDLYMFYDQGNEIMYWSSASSAAFLMPGKTFGRHKFLAYSKLADEHALILQPGTFERTRVFKVERKPFTLPRAVATPAIPITPRGVYGSTYPHQAMLDTGTAPVRLVAKNARKITPGYIQVPISSPPDGTRQYTITWHAMEWDTRRPEPFYLHFTNRWMALHREEADFRQGHRPEQTLYTGYGRWVWSWADNAVVRKFRPYKRTKDWWERAYRTRFTLPLKQEDKGVTVLDFSCTWEHYNLNVLLNDNTTRSFLGFMCPICGVWVSSVAAQTLGWRCEFCNVRSRLQAAKEGDDHG